MTRILMKINGLLMGVLLYGFALQAFAASYTYYIVKMPIEFESTALAINNFNTIVGTHQFSAHVKSAWIYQNGNVSPLASAGNCLTKPVEIFPMGINDNNIIVGHKNTCGKLSGFRLENGLYQELNWSLAGATKINDINNNGIMIGAYSLATQAPLFFSYNGINFTQLVHRATALNDSNYIVGDNYIHDSSAYQVTQVTKPGSQKIKLTGINNIGQTIGIQFNQNGKIRKSFVYDSTGFSPIDYPGSLWTIATGINDQGVITGWVSLAQNYNINGVYTGGNFSFMAIPDVAPNPNGTLPLPVDKTSPTISFNTPLNIEFSEQEIGNTLIGDFNQDGSDDFIVAHTVSQKLIIYYGQSANNAMFDNSIEIGRNGFYSIGYVSSLEKADFNGDGILDLVIGSRQCNNDTRKFMVAQGTTMGSFITGACLMLTANTGYQDSYVYSVAVADFNGDNNQDIVVSRNGNYGEKQILLYLGNGDMSFAAATIIYNAGTSSKRPYKILAADLNKDGFSDLLVEFSKFSRQSSTTLYIGDGTGKFPRSKPFTAMWPKMHSDMNKDGFPDKLISVDTKTLVYFGNNGGGFNSTPQIILIPSASNNNELSKHVGDFNGDGRNDLLVVNRNMGENILGKVYSQIMAPGITPIILPVIKPTVPTKPIIVPISKPVVSPVTKPVGKPVPLPTQPTKPVIVTPILKPSVPIVTTGVQVDFKGIIGAINTNSIVVNQIKVYYSTSTIFNFENGTGNTFAVGQFVGIQSFKNTDGSVNAFEIGVKP